MREQTFFMIKPDGVARDLADKVFSRINAAGFKVVVQKKIQMNQDLAAKLYASHQGKAFYDGLIAFITSGPVIVSIIEGEDVVLAIRKLMGATDPRQAETGTIRGDLKEDNVISEFGSIKNVVHGSDSVASAKIEGQIFFGKEIAKPGLV